MSKLSIQQGQILMTSRYTDAVVGTIKVEHYDLERHNYLDSTSSGLTQIEITPLREIAPEYQCPFGYHTQLGHCNQQCHATIAAIKKVVPDWNPFQTQGRVQDVIVTIKEYQILHDRLIYSPW